jgi:catechol 2,3-dioxygenase-like lactoylglutathione lyase family enzyme
MTESSYKIQIRGMAPLLSVFNMPASLAFYRDILGLKVTADSGQGDDSGWVMLERDGVCVMLNTQYDDGEEPPEADPVRFVHHLDTCLYFSTPDIDAVYEYLKDKVADIEAPSNAPYGMRQLYMRDPDGYNICFQWPVEGSKWSEK